MDFYYRSLGEGKCEVVCTRCFLTLGTASEIEGIRRLEENHCCMAPRAAAMAQNAFPPLAARTQADTLPFHRGGVPNHLPRNIFLLPAIAFLLYLLPVFFELSAMHTWSPWIAVVLPGDLAGCACLMLIFRRAKAGILLYGVLTAMEACLYALHIAPMRALPWITNLVPTVIVSALMLRPPSGSPRLIAID